AFARANQGSNPAPGGIWTSADGETVEGSTVPTTPGIFTYTVSQEGFCSATATVTITVQDIPQDCPDVTETAQEFCESVGEGNDGGHVSVAWLRPNTATWYATADSQVALDPAPHLVDGASYFAGSANGD